MILFSFQLIKKLSRKNCFDLLCFGHQICRETNNCLQINRSQIKEETDISQRYKLMESKMRPRVNKQENTNLMD